MRQIVFEKENEILKLLHSAKHVNGFTHNFYRYPACMSPELVREIINQFSESGDIVFDPFMGGGTTIVEALASGRRAIGIDINSLAVFITEVKTTPLSPRDENLIYKWAQTIDFSDIIVEGNTKNIYTEIKNLPELAQNSFNNLLNQVDFLPNIREQKFVRCCLLRLGQWAIDGKNGFPNPKMLQEKFFHYLQNMIDGLSELVKIARDNGTAKNKFVSQRLLLNRSAVDAHKDEKLRTELGKPKLVITSPPYPNVHVLYHRWQVAGRRETPAPYWFIGENNGHGASYFTCGSRSELGLTNYFQTIKKTFQSLKYILHPDALIVQLVSFNDTQTQLPEYLRIMELAGFQELLPDNSCQSHFWRNIPNRKWYNNISPDHSTGKELLLFHKPNIN
jgi:DNA modification methylase